MKCPECGGEMEKVDIMAPFRCDSTNPVYGPGPEWYGTVPCYKWVCKCGHEEKVT